MANGWFTKVLSAAPFADFLQAVTDETFRARLVDASYVHDPDHEFLSDTTGMLEDEPITGVALIRGDVTADDTTFTGVASGDTVRGVIIYISTGTPATSRLVGWMERGGDTLPILKETDGGDIVAEWPSGRMATI